MRKMDWKVKESDFSEDIYNTATKLEISPLLVSLLHNRGVHSPEKMELFLNPGLRFLEDLDKWPGLKESASLVAEAALDGKKICVWGDYDVDGISSTALIKEFFKLHNIECLHHIPNRLTDGYGLNAETLEDLSKSGVELLITVDSGISDIDAVAHAKELGMQVVITDHHLPGDKLPPADAIFNPRVNEEDEVCPCPHLAGVGVAFFLIAGINTFFVEAGKKRIDIRRFLDLVALGTLADVVNVCGQNRILVKNGLLSIGEGLRPGIAALKSVCNYAPAASLGAGQVVFSLAPRINAAGRLGSSEVALKLLLADDITSASLYAEELSQLNQARRDQEDLIFDEAMVQAKEQVSLGRMGLVLHHPEWHPGVIGIVASRMVESFHRPAIVLTSSNGIIKGSGRSFGRFNLHEAFTEMSSILLTYGGHRMAAGLSLSPDKIGELHKLFDKLARDYMGQGRPRGECLIDAELPFKMAADFKVLKELELLQPFGPGNAEPVFSSPPVLVRSIMSRPNFCSIDLQDEESGVTLRAKGWRELSKFPQSYRGAKVRIAFSPRIDRYNGVASVELRMKDWKLASDHVPDIPKAPEFPDTKA